MDRSVIYCLFFYTFVCLLCENQKLSASHCVLTVLYLNSSDTGSNLDTQELCSEPEGIRDFPLFPPICARGVKSEFPKCTTCRMSTIFRPKNSLLLSHRSTSSLHHRKTTISKTIATPPPGNFLLPLFTMATREKGRASNNYKSALLFNSRGGSTLPVSMKSLHYFVQLT